MNIEGRNERIVINIPWSILQIIMIRRYFVISTEIFEWGISG